MLGGSCKQWVTRVRPTLSPSSIDRPAKTIASRPFRIQMTTNQPTNQPNSVEYLGWDFRRLIGPIHFADNGCDLSLWKCGISIGIVPWWKKKNERLLLVRRRIKAVKTYWFLESSFLERKSDSNRWWLTLIDDLVWWWTCLDVNECVSMYVEHTISTHEKLRRCIVKRTPKLFHIQNRSAPKTIDTYDCYIDINTTNLESTPIAHLISKGPFSQSKPP